MPSALNQVKEPKLRHSRNRWDGLMKRVAVTRVTNSQNQPNQDVYVPALSDHATKAVKIICI